MKQDFTPRQMKMMKESGKGCGFFGYGVELVGPGMWATARSLVARNMGSIEGGAPNGSYLPGLFFNNIEAVRLCLEFEDFDEDLHID